jgi:hypothetical protein
MKTIFGDQFKHLEKVFNGALKDNPTVSRQLADCTFEVGLASDPSFGVPAFAAESALFVGDSGLYGELIGANAELNSMFKKNPSSVCLTPEWNWRTKKYDMRASKYVKDADALLPAQLLSPWNVSWFQGVFKKPLSWSKAGELVKAYTGTDPWAEVMSLLLADYSGFAAYSNTGRPDNMLTQNVSVQAGMMSSQVINMTVTYALTMEEIERAKGSSPFSGTLITQKQKYADYVLEMLRSYLIYYGNSSTDTLGLISLNGATSFGGTSLKDIKNDTANVTKGSTAYRYLASIIADFLTAADNKFNHIKLAMSPEAYNYLSTFVYSDVYNPTAAIKTIRENLEADMTKDGRTLKIDIISDPLLKQSTIFNAQVYDYLVIVATEIDAGPNEEAQDIALWGEPISEFVYPTIPGSYHTQYKKLKRVAGLFCPVPSAVKVYSGFGVDS